MQIECLFVVEKDETMEGDVSEPRCASLQRGKVLPGGHKQLERDPSQQQTAPAFSGAFD